MPCDTLKHTCHVTTCFTFPTCHVTACFTFPL